MHYSRGRAASSTEDDRQPIKKNSASASEGDGQNRCKKFWGCSCCSTRKRTGEASKQDVCCEMTDVYRCFCMCWTSSCCDTRNGDKDNKKGCCHGWDIKDLPRSRIVPTGLLFISFVMWCYRQYTETEEDLSLAVMLGLNCIQMVPLMALKVKILVHPDVVTVLSKFSTKVLLMHMSFIALRVVVDPSGVDFEPGEYWVFLGALTVAMLMLTMDNDFSWKDLFMFKAEHRDIWFLISFAIVMMAGQVWYIPDTLRLTCLSNRLEILSFMPAVWMLYKMDRCFEVFQPLPEASSQRRAICFFTFVVGYYVYEDLIMPVITFPDVALYLGGHGVHLLLIVDFGSFFIMQSHMPKFKHEDFSEPMQLENMAV